MSGLEILPSEVFLEESGITSFKKRGFLFSGLAGFKLVEDADSNPVTQEPADTEANEESLFLERTMCP